MKLHVGCWMYSLLATCMLMLVVSLVFAEGNDSLSELNRVGLAPLVEKQYAIQMETLGLLQTSEAKPAELNASIDRFSAGCDAMTP